MSNHIPETYVGTQVGNPFLADADVFSGPEVLSETSASPPPPADPPGLFARIIRLSGIDRAIAFTVLARGWSSLAGLLTITLIARFLSPAAQGYYYVFYSIVALQIIFELGFSVVILQTASHECAHLHLQADGVISGPPRAHRRLASIFQKSIRWYGAASVLLLLTLLPAGRYFFRLHVSPNSNISWVGPWSLLAVATIFTFQVDPVFSFLEGCGYVPQVARSRLAQAIAGSLLGWLALLSHHGLYAPGMILVGQALVGSYAISRKRALLWPLLQMPTSHEGISWGSEIWPFQWRVAVSWVCGYLIFQLFTPVLFASPKWGAVEAGRMGMTISVAGALSAISVSWINTKAAPFGRLIALKDFARLDRIFFHALLQATAISLLASTAVWCGVFVLDSHHAALSHRVLAPLPFGLFLGAGVVNNIVIGFAIYLRAHKQEKFMFPSILGAIWGVAVAYLLGRPYGALGITAGYLAGTIGIGIGIGGSTFAKYRKLWHA